MAPSRLVVGFLLSACLAQAAWEVDFADDFEGDLSQWADTGCAVISYGSLYICKSHDTIHQAAAYGPWADFRYEADIWIDEVAAGVVVRRLDGNNLIMLQFNALYGTLRPHLRQGGSWTVLAEIPADIRTGEWQHVVIESLAGWITTWLDGVEVYRFFHDFPAAGGIGFRTGNSEDFYVDNLVLSVGVPDPPDPPGTPTGLRAAPLWEGQTGIYIEWDGSSEPVDRWEIILTPDSVGSPVIRQLLPGERASVWLPVPEGIGACAVSIRGSNAGGVSDWVSTQSRPGGTPPAGFNEWIHTLLPEGFAPDAYAAESNFDRDALVAIFEYAVGRDPAVAEFGPLLTLDMEGFPPEPVLTESVIRGDVEIFVERSGDLSSWMKYPQLEGNVMEPMEESNPVFYRSGVRADTDNWLEATDLRVELLREAEPVALLMDAPLFSWALRSGDPAGVQTACQVLVATDPALLAPGQANVWDSGKQPGDTPRIRIPDGILSSEGNYFWTVRLWNADDQPAEFAPSASFQTGILGSSAYSPRPVQVQTPVAPVALAVNNAGNTFIDFGRAAFGTIRFRVPGAVGGESVTIHLGEKREVEEQVDRSPGATIRYVQASAVVEPSDGWTTVVIPDYDNWPSIAELPSEIGKVAPFRYVEMAGLPAPITPADIEQLAVHTPWDEEASAFASSDDILNQVWDLCKYSIKATTFAAVYIDGDRERLPYEADAYINQLGHYGCEPAYALARFSHEWLIDHPTWPTEWKHHSILMAHTDWLYTGDTASLERCYARLQPKLFPGSERADQLINPPTNDLVDWPSGERDGYVFVPYNTVVNAFQYRALRCMEEIATALGNSTDAAQYAARADTLYGSFNSVFWDGAQQRYVDGEGTTHASLHANMFALAHGLVPPERRDAVVDFVIGKGMACSVYGAHYLVEALFAENEDAAAVDLMRSVGVRSWYNMIRVGSTITLEAWDQAYKGNLDWNHAWGAAPAAAIPRWVMGVRPVDPGFSTILVQPHLGELEWIDGKVPTPVGPVEVRVNRDAGSALTAAIKAPPGCRVRIELPLPEGASGNLRLNGEVTPHTSQGGRAILPELPAGAYLIEIE
ncbi:MAG: alpha-L-rhamnosidase C-terminal domain-containing protein [Oceanipulchritudo sp.]